MSFEHFLQSGKLTGQGFKLNNYEFHLIRNLMGTGKGYKSNIECKTTVCNQIRNRLARTWQRAMTNQKTCLYCAHSVFGIPSLRARNCSGSAVFFFFLFLLCNSAAMSIICNGIHNFTHAEHDKHIDGIRNSTITAQYIANTNILFLSYCVISPAHLQWSPAIIASWCTYTTRYEYHACIINS